uniref:Uncharacterized protein n=1 Tax=Calcidiscus leptoporus TaxID=127549 RepID=A0A7S0ITI3_9EUKA
MEKTGKRPGHDRTLNTARTASVGVREAVGLDALHEGGCCRRAGRPCGALRGLGSWHARHAHAFSELGWHEWARKHGAPQCSAALSDGLVREMDEALGQLRVGEVWRDGEEAERVWEMWRNGEEAIAPRPSANGKHDLDESREGPPVEARSRRDLVPALPSERGLAELPPEASRVLGAHDAERPTFFMVVAAVRKGCFVLLSDGMTQLLPGRTTSLPGERAAGRDGEAGSGGYFVWRSAAAALAASVPPSSRVLEAPRALLRVYVGGTPRRLPQALPYNDGRLCFPVITPVSVVAQGRQLLELYERFLGR